MTGQELTRILDIELAERGMSQKEFCNILGIGSSAMSAWRKGSMPTPKRLAEIERLLEIDLADYEQKDESDELREILRNRQDLRVLLHSAKDVPPSSVYMLIAQLEKEKENDG